LQPSPSKSPNGSISVPVGQLLARCPADSFVTSPAYTFSPVLSRPNRSALPSSV
jgi:hypothetical protein